MAVAMIYPNGEKGGRGKLSRYREGLSRTEENNISKARSVMKHLPDKAKQVLSGGATLESAYKEALDKKNEADSDEAKKKRRTHKRIMCPSLGDSKASAFFSSFRKNYSFNLVKT